MPKKKIKVDFSKPKELTDAEVAFPTRVDHLMPEYKDIPEEFSMYNGTSPFCKLQATWFFKGLKPEDIPPVKEGIDRTVALRHLMYLQGSWEPKHEHKSAAVAYLMSLWFEEPK